MKFYSWSDFFVRITTRILAKEPIYKLIIHIYITILTQILSPSSCIDGGCIDGNIDS